MKHTLRKIALSALTLLGASAQAGIVNNPGSIIDNGTYITDTVNHLDWYKFSNDVSTVGMSYNAVLASPQFAGWYSADRGQVQGLQTQFGWSADTSDFSNNENLGLTRAMATYVGYTAIEVFDQGNSDFIVSWLITAMTYDWRLDSNSYVEQNVALSEFQSFENTGTGSHVEYGDYIDGESSWQMELTKTEGIGTWLTRVSVETTPPTCGNADHPCPNNVPEPTSITMVGLGLVGLVAKRKSIRAATTK